MREGEGERYRRRREGGRGPSGGMEGGGRWEGQGTEGGEGSGKMHPPTFPSAPLWLLESWDGNPAIFIGVVHRVSLFHWIGSINASLNNIPPPRPPLPRDGAPESMTSASFPCLPFPFQMPCIGRVAITL